MLDENTDKLLRNTSMAKKKEVNSFLSCGGILGCLVVGVFGKTPLWQE